MGDPAFKRILHREMKEAFEKKLKLSPLSVQAPLDKLDLKHF